jgi:hypothetical protein
MTDSTTVALHESLGRYAGVAFAVMLTTSSTMPVTPGAENLALLKESIRANPTVSCSQHLVDTGHLSQAMRATQIRALRGKYHHLLTPSDEFARRKQEEIARESEGQ